MKKVLVVMILLACSLWAKPEMVLVEKGVNKVNGKSLGIIYDVYFGKYEVTIGEFVEFLNSYGIDKDGKYKGIVILDLKHKNSFVAHNGKKFVINPWKDNRGKDIDLKKYPMNLVSWQGAAAYCNWLSEKEKLPKAYDEKTWKVIDDKVLSKTKGYRLPSIVEWLYVSKGGKKCTDMPYAGSKNLDEVAWYEKNSTSDGNTNIGSQKNKKYGTMPVGTKKANELGIYDILGNVEEWGNAINETSKYREHLFFGEAFPGTPLLGGFFYSVMVPTEEPIQSLGFRVSRTKY